MKRSRTQVGRRLLLVLAASVAVPSAWLWWWKTAPSAETSPPPVGKSILGATNAPSAIVPKIQARNIHEPLVLIETSRPVPALAFSNSATLIDAHGLTASSERVLALQIALVRQGISPGSLDAVMGSQTRGAISAFQQKIALPVTGELDEASQLQLFSAGPSLTNYVIASQDLLSLRPLAKTWLAKSQQDRMDYESILELIAEKSLSSPHLIRRLNPAIDWGNVVAGLTVRIPLVESPPLQAKAAFIRILLAARTLQAFDHATNLLAHFPCSIAQRVDKRPLGALHVAVLAPNPNYTFDPEVFPESAEAQELGRKLILQPGPNNPVGTVWIGLDKPGYGIHGTPSPEQVGRTESHGCFRLANWNADYLLKLVWVGMPVHVEP